MNFDFVTLYNNRSNAELLKILFKPDEYQAEAVKAAEDILATRIVTDDDRRSAGFIIEEPVIADPAVAKEYQVNYQPESDHLNAFDNALFEEKNNRVFNIFLVLAGLYYLRIFYKATQNIYFILSRDNFSVILIIDAFVYLILVPVAFYKLYKRKPFGWYIIFGETLLSFVSSCVSFVIYSRWFTYDSLINIIFSFLPMLLRPAILYFLWRKRNAEAVGVSVKNKQLTVFICVGFLVLVFGVVWFMESGQSF